MTVKEAAEELSEQVPGDDFQALESKIYRTIELYKAARESATTAEREAEKLRMQLREQEQQTATLRREAIELRREREEVRSRVEKMLDQIENLAQERVAS